MNEKQGRGTISNKDFNLQREIDVREDSNTIRPRFFLVLRAQKAAF